jgi:hypothetical protein
MSGNGVRIAQITAMAIRTPPLHRSGVFSRQTTTSPAVTSSSGPVPNAAIRPTAPGSCATNSTTWIIQSMPAPIRCQNTPSKPNGMASRPSSPIGITQTDTTGMASRLAITPYGASR